MIDKTLSHYRTVEKIGAGGMGEVYRAHDERLERDVALKVLPTGTLADEAARKRFRKEALALSKLNHPNIATVFDFDTQDGVDFLVMELVEGVTLSDKLAVGPLREKEITRLGGQVAEALEEAHERGVVHRDLKPGNVMVTAKGQVKILDFGLAKLVRPDVASATAPTESFTETQAVAGTLPYMAPEQLRGEQVDARTDIHALGAVLYEMATGQRPFPETQGPRLIDSILHQAPQPPSGLNRRVSPGLEGIILKALEKEPENRYQHANEVAVDLRRLGTPGSAAAVLSARRPATRRGMVWAAGVALVALLAVLVGLNVAGLRERLLGRIASGQITSLAVLPLANLSGDPEQEYFADGIHEELIANLAKIGALTVISRTSVMQYKEARKPLPEIARELGVDAVIEGSVRRVGDQVRITVQLVEAATGRHLWAESYRRELRDILALESEVARAIAQEIKIALTPEEETRLADARPVNPEAYEAYLKGRYHWSNITEEGFWKSIDYFQQAIEKDPSYAPAYAGLAQSYLFLGQLLPPREIMPKARAAVTKALELDDTLAEAHTQRALIKMKDWDWVGAEKEFRRALELNPKDALTHLYYAQFLNTVGRHQEALAEAKRAEQLDPLSPFISANVIVRYGILGEYDQAIEQSRKALELNPNFWLTHSTLAGVYRKKGMYDEAIAGYRKAASGSGAYPWPLAHLAYTYGLAGRRREGLEILFQLKELSEQRYVRPDMIAHAYAGLGQKDEALQLLEKAHEMHELDAYRFVVRGAFEPLRDDPRFQELLRRMNLPP
jgi:serine/threonine-protein kinase